MTKMLVALAALFAAAGLINGGSAAAEADPEPIDLEAVVIKVVDSSSACPVDFEAPSDALEMTPYQAICVDPDWDLTLTPRDNLVADAGVNRLIVGGDFQWEGNTPRALASFDIESGDSSRAVNISLSPELGVLVVFDEPSEGTTDQGDLEQNQDQENDSQTGLDRESSLADAEQTDPVEKGSVLLGQRQRNKSILVTGRDNEIPGLVIREQIRAGQFRAILDEEDTGPEVVSGPNGERIDFELSGGSVTYDLALVDGANFGSALTTQKTELVLGDAVMASKTIELNLEAPLATVAVQALAQVVGGEDTVVSVRVVNEGETPINGPLLVALTPIEGEGLVEGFDEVDDGTVEGNTVSWLTAADLGPGDQIVQTIQVDLNVGSSDSRVKWQGILARQNVDVPIDTGTTTTDIIAAPPGSDAGVQFTPDQLIRLIAFVMAFALVAVIFGAWNRGGKNHDGEHDEDHHKNELELFRAYTEAILVLVILVSILVLALRGSLSGESAASLIGVIAGYALGRSTSGK